jgi:NAD(P)-dependent dehydrogenase (short-subunit alcohol dehydrogenase family)
MELAMPAGNSRPEKGAQKPRRKRRADGAAERGQAATAPFAVVAGAASGIGEAVALRLLAAGWDVAALARRRERLVALAQRHPASVLALPCDITDEAAVTAAAERIGGLRQALDALIVTAGDFLVRPLEGTEPGDFERIWRVSVFAKYLLARKFLPLLRNRGAEPGGRNRPARAGDERKPAAVVFISSLAAHRDFADECAYTSAMHGVIGLARSLDVELRDRGIRVSVVSPGLVRTELTERSGFSTQDLEQALPADDIARSVEYLISTIREGGYIEEIFHVPGAIRY